MASEAPPTVRSTRSMNRWTFEPLLLLLFWGVTFISGLIAFAFFAAGMSGVFAVAVVLALWAVAGVWWAWARRPSSP